MYICITLIHICAVIRGVLLVSVLEANWSFHIFSFPCEVFRTMMLDLLVSKTGEKCSHFIISRHLFSIDNRTKLCSRAGRHTELHTNTCLTL